VAVRCRPARPEERLVLEDIQRRASLEWPSGYRRFLLAHPDAVALPAELITDGRVVVAEDGPFVVGFAVVLPRRDRAAELDGLFVDPGWWRRGIGRALIGEAERLAAGLGAAGLDVVANPQALAFYEACGFVTTGSAETRFGPAITMTKALP
jgi:GNAT superfamily N-acetyltransferase